MAASWELKERKQKTKDHQQFGCCQYILNSFFLIALLSMEGAFQMKTLLLVGLSSKSTMSRQMAFS